jgi:hypothetical protein
VDVFQAQSTLLAMCAAEQLLTRDELTQLRSCLQHLQAAAVELGTRAGTAEYQQRQQCMDVGVSRFKLSLKVRPLVLVLWQQASSATHAVTAHKG